VYTFVLRTGQIVAPKRMHKTSSHNSSTADTSS